MSMFRRPTDDSSDSDSDSSAEGSDGDGLNHSQGSTEHSNAGTEEIVGADLTTVGTLSSGESISIDHSREETTIGDVEHVRNMMLASLLEDFYRTRAAELHNAANPGANFHRQSPEIQPLAKSLFDQASQALSSNGLLPSNVVSDEVRNTRGQYLAGFDTFGLQNIKDSDLLPPSMKRRISANNNQLAMVRLAASTQNMTSSSANSNHPIHDLALRAEQMSIVPHPANDMQLSSVQAPRSHYKSSFQEVRLLGRGGFGRVYQTYNLFDQREYAVKKIPLSIKLSQQYKERGHTELASILREVQALAQLDHCNVVRYHATWIEDPTNFNPINTPSFRSPFSRQKLIADRPTFSPSVNERRRSSNKFISFGTSDGIKFEVDSTDERIDQEAELGWSHHSPFRQRESSIPDSDIFTDGMAQNNRADKIADDPSCYVLHVQMSMYPTTLAQYLSATPVAAKSGLGSPVRHHCFHLIPALRILLGILCGLQYIHARGLVHRDIKPSNIFLSSHEVQPFMHSPDGYYDVGTCPSCSARQPYYVNPRIGDFGLVADLAQGEDPSSSSKSSSGGAVGTEYYRPPLDNGKRSARRIDEKLDVYALGVVLVEMLWRCGTNMERIGLLKDLQKGTIPARLITAVEAEGYSPETGNMVKECIEGMIEKDHSMRWDCSKTKEHLESILSKCRRRSESAR